MRAALITGARELELVDVADAPPVPGTVTVDVTLCGICGTEVGSFRSGVLHSPSVCGHEWVGVVSAVGAGVGSPLEGERVVIGVCAPCGDCPECRAGYCRELPGREHDGPWQGPPRTRTTAASPAGSRSRPIGSSRPIPACPTFRRPSWSRRRSRSTASGAAEIRPGDLVAVLGAGPIGLLAMQFARAAGAGHVVMIEPSERRRRLAAELGADVALPPDEAAEHCLDLSRGVGCDVVVEASGVASLLQTAVDLSRAGGTVTLLSYLASPSEVNGARIMAREARIVGANAYTRADFRRTMDLIVDGRVRVEPMHTRTVGLDGLPQALADLAAGTGDDVKVLVDPSMEVQ